MADGDDELDLDPENLDPPPEQQDDQQDADADQQDDEQVDDQAEQEDGQQPDFQSRSPPPPPEGQRRSRSEDRIRTLTDSNRELIRQNAELTRRFDDFVRQRNQPAQETPEQRAQRLATLTPEERLTEQLNFATQQHRQDMQMLQSQVLEGNDKAAFEARCTPGSVRAKWKDRVEKELTDMRNRGANAPREAVYFYLLGKAMDERQGSGENRQQRRAADTRVRRQTTRPAANGSDVRADRGRQTSLERRLENVDL